MSARSAVPVDVKDRAFAGSKMPIPQEERTKRRIRSVSWCLMCHAAAYACLQSVLLFSPLHPINWLSSSVKSVLSLRFLAFMAEVCVLTAVQAILISQSLSSTAQTVRLSKINQLVKDANWRKKNSALSLASKTFRTVVDVVTDLPLKTFTGDHLKILLSNTVTTLLIGLFLSDSNNNPMLQSFFFLMAGTFVTVRTTYGLHPLDAVPVVNLPLWTQVKSIFKETPKTLFLPTLKSFIGLNAFILIYQLLVFVWAEDSNFLAIFSYLSISFLLKTFCIFYFLVLLLSVNNRVTEAVFLTNWYFPIEATEEGQLSLFAALESTKQLKLAASRYLLFISELDVLRRSELWVISQPGGHPTRFNKLMQIFSDSVQNFQKDFDLKKDHAQKAPINSIQSNSIYFSPNKSIQSIVKKFKNLSFNGNSFGSPLLSSTPNQPSTPVQTAQPMSRFRGLLYQTPQTPTIRPMESIQSPLRLVPVKTVPNEPFEVPTKFEAAMKSVQEFFKADPETEMTHDFANISKLVTAVMAEAPFLSFMVSAVSNLVLASVVEDKFGIVQIKLQEIISPLITLLHTIEQRIALGSALSSKMSASDVAKVNRAMDLVQDATSRALGKICKTFGESLLDLKWSDKERETMTLYL
ncbi:uncharacterized protein LOC132196709 [Neocloeon triangulifer]|uniref:uncharacterized protein LOC132196709 n=1 Tax=Neocloeon triangulifer TaxID=2078957 RepID=UPI00286F74C8|nr:uncharacterized protein LOC132196709 [Neocloeon triangulifer]